MNSEFDLEVSEVKSTNFITKLVNLFVSPTELFQELKEKSKLGFPLTTLLVLGLLNLFLSAKYITPMVVTKTANYYSHLGKPDIAKATLAQLNSPIFLTVTIGLVSFLIGWIFYAFILWIISLLFKGKTSFGTNIVLATYLMIFSSIGTLLTLIPQIILKADFNVLSLQVLTPNLPLFSYLTPILSSLSVFGIWSILLTAIGLNSINDFKKYKGYTISILFTLLGIGFSEVGILITNYVSTLGTK